MYYLGIELHKDELHIAALDGDAGVAEEIHGKNVKSAVTFSNPREAVPYRPKCSSY
jgi:hypothetical protein